MIKHLFPCIFDNKYSPRLTCGVCEVLKIVHTREPCTVDTMNKDYNVLCLLVPNLTMIIDNLASFTNWMGPVAMEDNILVAIHLRYL